MSDTSQGGGWWMASDGKWYAPESHPEYVQPSSVGPNQPELEEVSATERSPSREPVSPSSDVILPPARQSPSPGWKQPKVWIGVGVVTVALVVIGTLALAPSRKSGSATSSKPKAPTTTTTTSPYSPAETAFYTALNAPTSPPDFFSGDGSPSEAQDINEANLVCTQFQAGHTVPWLFFEVNNYFQNLGDLNITSTNGVSIFLETAADLCPQLTSAITETKQADGGWLTPNGPPPSY